MELQIKGIVKNSREFRGRYTLNLHTRNGVLKCNSEKLIYDGTPIEARLEKDRDYYRIIEYKKIDEKEVEEELSSSIKILDLNPVVEEEAIKKMWGEIKKVAIKIKTAERMGRDVIVRFNNDADGISSALLLKEVMRGYYIQHNAPIYYKRDAFNDLNNLMNRYKPLLILLDFGANEESEEALDIVKSAGIEIIIIDHHPTERKNEEKLLILNPHLFGGESNITTGYLCFEIARMLGKENKELLKISLAGDKSNIIKIDEEDKNNALIIDYVATYLNYGGKLDFYQEVMKNKEMKETILMQAKEKLEEVKDYILKHMKHDKVGEFRIYTINLDEISTKAEFPSRSKITSQLYEIIKDENAIVLGVTNKSIIFRITEKANENGVDASKIIEEIKRKYPEHILSGGGHSKAAAIRVKNEEMFNFIKKEIKEYIRKINTKGGEDEKKGND